MATLGELPDISVLEYQAPSGRRPFSEWVESLRDRKVAAVIWSRIDRVALGQLGNHRNVGDRVWELKIPMGPGYRIYYIFDGKQLIILLCGGDKSSQWKDIQKAKKLADDYWRRKP